MLITTLVRGANLRTRSHTQLPGSRKHCNAYMEGQFYPISADSSSACLLLSKMVFTSICVLLLGCSD